VLFSTDIVSGFKLLLSKNLSSDGQSAGNQSLPSTWEKNPQRLYAKVLLILPIFTNTISI
jgi:hypothetical protein